MHYVCVVSMYSMLCSSPITNHYTLPPCLHFSPGGNGQIDMGNASDASE